MIRRIRILPRFLNRSRYSEGDADEMAATWIARRDRGLTSAEQDEFLEWLRADPAHGEALKTHQATLAQMMRLGDWQPAFSSDPNPDLFAPCSPGPSAMESRLRRYALAAAGIAAAAILLLRLTSVQSTPGPDPYPQADSPYLVHTEAITLEDGSVVQLKEGSRVTTAYSPAERRVLLKGNEVESEAYFTVAKDPDRPFVVEIAGIEVMALGTEFNVRSDLAAVDVLVTSGIVRVASKPERRDEKPPAPSSEAILAAGERALVPLKSGQSLNETAIQRVTDEEIESVLEWQQPLLRFHETPLGVAVEEFNRYNSRRIEVFDPLLREIRIGGVFRVDNVDGFLKSLELSLEVEAVPLESGRTILWRDL